MRRQPRHHHPLIARGAQLPTPQASLPPGFCPAKRHGDDAYLETLAQALSLALRLHAPDLILYRAGVDVHQDDELGYLS